MKTRLQAAMSLLVAVLSLIGAASAQRTELARTQYEYDNTTADSNHTALIDYGAVSVIDGLETTAPGGRNTALNKAAWKLGRRRRAPVLGDDP